MSDDGVVIERTLPASRELVFRAWTQPELMARWFFPAEDWSVSVESDLRVGGQYVVVMVDPGGGEHRQSGHYRVIEPVSRLVFTWSCPELGVEDSVVTVELEDASGETALRLKHELPPDPVIRREHEGGWDGCLGSLERFLQHQERKDDQR